jgi:inosine/xanthosine triphosphatase
MVTNSIYVGSQNPAKIKAVQIALQQMNLKVEKPYMAEVIGEDVPSGVAAQPRSDEETIEGAIHRCHELRRNYPESICIGLEGGVHETERGMFLCNWGSLITQEGQVYVAGGARIPLPDSIAHGIRQGIELGEVIDRYAGQHDIRKKGGAIGILSHGFLDRPHMFADVTTLLFGQMFHYSRSYKIE